MSNQSAHYGGPRHRGVGERVRKGFGLILGITILALLFVWFRWGDEPPIEAATEPPAGSSQTASRTPAPVDPTPLSTASVSTPPVAPTSESEAKPTTRDENREASLDPKQVKAEAKAALEAYLELFDSALKGDTIDSKSLEAVSVGSAQGELEAAAADYAEQKFLQVGDVRILSVDFSEMSLEDATPSVLAEVCIDSHEVDIVDESGNSLAEFLFRPGEPFLQTFEMTFKKPAWRVSAHQISDEVVGC